MKISRCLAAVTAAGLAAPTLAACGGDDCGEGVAGGGTLTVGTVA